MVTNENYLLVSVQELTYWFIITAPVKHGELFRDEGNTLQDGANCLFYHLIGKVDNSRKKCCIYREICMILMPLSFIVIKHVVCLITHGLFISLNPTLVIPLNHIA